VTETEYDVIVIGAGPAGCSAAYDLSQASRSVLLLDRRTFPRVKACGGGLTVKTLNALRYSVAPVVSHVASDLVVGRQTEETALFRSDHPICALARRADFDAFCLERTMEMGAEFRTVRSVLAVTQEDDRVTVRTHADEITARFVVAADGANSTVRRLVTGRPVPSLGFALEAIAPMPEIVPEMEFDFGVVEYGYGWVFPKGDHLNIGLYTNSPDVRISKADVDAYAREKVGDLELREHVGHKIGLRGWEAPLSAGQVLFVGDAAGLVDPLLGEGIHNAIVSGQAAAHAILAGLNGGSAATAFSQRMRPILSDIRSAHRSAARFYQNVNFGYRVLKSPMVRHALMKGYARGMTFDETKKWFVLMPVLPAKLFPAVQELVDG
jgi:geranylgeranyl reductase family protein